MNAYELAEEIEWMTEEKLVKWCNDASTMLRQQADRIAELEKVSSKPVAWMDYLEHSDVYDLNVSGRGIPLYTHPVKQLSDEEISNIYEQCFDWDKRNLWAFNFNKFARAIIKEITE